jgi:hypothetical protein
MCKDQGEYTTEGGDEMSAGLGDRDARGVEGWVFKGYCKCRRRYGMYKEL